MSEAKFTKGPWAAEYERHWRGDQYLSRIVGADGKKIVLAAFTLTTGGDEANANALLCAAAPRMYSVLELSHACATVRPDGACDGCPVSEVLAEARGEHS